MLMRMAAAMPRPMGTQRMRMPCKALKMLTCRVKSGAVVGWVIDGVYSEI